MQKTTLAKAETTQRGWVLVDLSGKILGRAATKIADILRGKTKVMYTPHMDAGDFVVAINAAKIRLTGKKLTDKIYYRHSGFRGGLKETPAGKLLQKDPTQLIIKAVKGMLPKNRMQDHLLKKLKVYAADKHPHAAQQPKAVEV
ncbi:MAG TPA: 50S ribosomal protein L13 [bacterium]|nr:50S ribosomal protein L13 [bacterium]